MRSHMKRVAVDRPVCFEGAWKLACNAHVCIVQKMSAAAKKWTFNLVIDDLLGGESEL